MVNFLIIFFTFLIIYQIFFDNSNSFIEAMTDTSSNQPPINLTVNDNYKQYDKTISDNTFLLAQQNAGNIEYLKQRIDSIQGMNQQLQDLSGNVQSLQTQVNGLVEAQQEYANQMTGGSPPQITGLVDEDTDNTNDS